MDKYEVTVKRAHYDDTADHKYLGSDEVYSQILTDLDISKLAIFLNQPK